MDSGPRRSSLPRWHLAASPADWLARASAFVAAAERQAIAARGAFHIVLAGGGTPRLLYQALAREQHDWSRWHIWFGDERCLPESDPERNSHMARQAWLDHVPFAPGRIHVIPAEHGAQTAAQAYAGALARVADFDLVLLGLGEDGHTASLFPGQAWGKEDWGAAADAPDVLPVFAAPKPPPERVSLSAQRLARARRVLFLLAGAGKREPLGRWLNGEPIPAAAIRPEAGVDVLLDAAACPPELRPQLESPGGPT